MLVFCFVTCAGIASNDDSKGTNGNQAFFFFFFLVMADAIKNKGPSGVKVPTLCENVDDGVEEWRVGFKPGSVLSPEEERV